MHKGHLNVKNGKGEYFPDFPYGFTRKEQSNQNKIYFDLTSPKKIHSPSQSNSKQKSDHVSRREMFTKDIIAASNNFYNGEKKMQKYPSTVLSDYDDDSKENHNHGRFSVHQPLVRNTASKIHTERPQVT